MGFVTPFFVFANSELEPVVGTAEPTPGVGGGIDIVGEATSSETFSCFGCVVLLAGFCLGGRVIRAEIRANSGDGSLFTISEAGHLFPSSWFFTTGLMTLQGQYYTLRNWWVREKTHTTYKCTKSKQKKGNHAFINNLGNQYNYRDVKRWHNLFCKSFFLHIKIWALIYYFTEYRKGTWLAEFCTTLYVWNISYTHIFRGCASGVGGRGDAGAKRNVILGTPDSPFSSCCPNKSSCTCFSAT